MTYIFKTHPKLSISLPGATETELRNLQIIPAFPVKAMSSALDFSLSPKGGNRGEKENQSILTDV